MDAKYKYLIKNTGILTISNFSSKLLTFFLLPLYTSVLSTSEYGSYDLIVTTLSVAIPVLTVNIVAGVMRFCMDAAYDKAEIFSVGLKYTCISCVFVGLLLVLIHFYNLVPLVTEFGIFIFLFYCANVFQQFSQNFAKGLERITDLGIGGVLGTAFSLLFNIAFLLAFKRGIKGFYLAHILSSTIVSLFLLLRTKFWNYITLKEYKKTDISMIRYSAPLVALQLGWWLNSSFDKYMVSAMLGIAENGLLSVAYKPAAVIHTLYGVFSPAWEISAIKELENEDSAKFYSTVFMYLNATLCISCSFIFLFVKQISKILYAKEFFDAWRYVPFLVLSSVITESAAYLGAILTAKKDTKSLALSTIIGAGVNIGMNIVLIRVLGTLGATIATVISSFSIFVYRKLRCGDIVFKKSLAIVFFAWSILIAQSMCVIYWNFVWLQFLLLCTVIVFFCKPLLYLVKKTGKKLAHGGSNGRNL